MGFVAVKGGEEAIKHSLGLFEEEFISEEISLDSVCRGMRLGVDRVMSEGSLYSKKLAAKSLIKASGDTFNAAFFLRAHRSSCERIGVAKCIDTDSMRLVRRISSAFKEIEGGQILGANNDYQIKLLNTQNPTKAAHLAQYDKRDKILPSALKTLREAGYIRKHEREESPDDITRVFPTPPYSRSAMMQAMSRGESGSMLGFAYTSMRGYGDIHPTIGDLRLGSVAVRFTHPITQKEVVIGEIEVSAVECVGEAETQLDGSVKLNTGFGFCFGFNETKAICMGILDLNLYATRHRENAQHFASSCEMILHHIDGVDSMGFANHYKLPHYVTFQAILQVFEKANAFRQSKQQEAELEDSKNGEESTQQDSTSQETCSYEKEYTQKGVL